MPRKSKKSITVEEFTKQVIAQRPLHTLEQWEHATKKIREFCKIELPHLEPYLENAITAAEKAYENSK